jgi:hypothetical protein
MLQQTHDYISYFLGKRGVISNPMHHRQLLIRRSEAGSLN